ncbi:Abhydrolase domain-containing protein mpaH [Colletotrichum shisoi]|uniref:Abhydrolase domain-containing protein mpaH n=1 Tax=Colletotrichum shisoi TaxID=2078593 RepID=A0A5Q4BW82_9PEZI|nr:Abhydrolase domain-containing protein mpaH [Colletotrichum shisoi]
MSFTSVFHVREHVLDGSHIREFPRALSRSQDDVLKIAVKEYIPKDNPNPKPGDITIIGAHANGFPKELYEALWQDLHAESLKPSSTFRIRSIIIADAAWQGASAALNEPLLGNDPGWLDHPRDLLHLINTLRPPRPLVGIGHSFGGNAIVNVALIHPRLFSAIVLLDPVISKWSSNAKGTIESSPAAASARRRDLWPSRAAARAAFLKSPFYRAWDPRVFDAWLHHGLRDLPTQLYPTASPEADAAAAAATSEKDRAVTLATTKHQEVFTYFRPSWDAYDAAGRELVRPDLVPDMDPGLNEGYFTFPVYRSEGASTLARLPQLRPRVLYVFGGDSDLSTPDLREEKMQMTGTGVGGSGGAARGKVREVTLPGAGHLFPMEVPGTSAELSAGWIEEALADWRAEQADYERWTRLSVAEKTTLTDEWIKRLGGPARPPKAKAKI